MNNKTVFTAVSNSTVPASVLLGSKNKAAKNGLSFESLLSEGLNSTAKKTRGSEAQAYNSAFSNHLEANTSESAFSPVFSKETGLKGGFEHNTTEWPQNELENEQSIAAKKS